MPPAVLTDEGACRGTDPEVFFPMGNHKTLAAAADICAGCDHRQLCLDWAIETGQAHGVYGGLSPERRHNRTKEAQP